MEPHDIRLITADIGNVNTKFRRHGGAWVLEPSLVQMAGDTASFHFGGEVSQPLRPLLYQAGPAQLPATPYLLGADAEQRGATDVPIIGSADVRVRSAPYLLLHLYAILASLPVGVTGTTVLFAGGVPMADYGTAVVEVLKQRLIGTHIIEWGDRVYEVTVARVMLVPQPIGGIATLLFTPDGQPVASDTLLRTRFGMDVGGGTTDYTARVGLQAIAGMEGGVTIGVHTAAEYARRLIAHDYLPLRTLEVGRVLALLRGQAAPLTLAGEPIDVHAQLASGVAQASEDILAHMLPRWQRRLAEGEVLLYGGGGALFADTLTAQLGALTRVTLLSEPVLRVADGIERMARHAMQRVGEPRRNE